MRSVVLLSAVLALASAADYVADAPPPASYAPEKPPISAPVLALIAKLLEALQGYDYDVPAPAAYADAPSYANTDLLKLLKLAAKPKKYATKTTLKILDRLPGLYGGVPPYAVPPYVLPPALLPAYKPPALGFLHPYAAPHLNPLYAPAPPAYHPAPKLPLGPAGVYGYPGHPAVSSYPGLAGIYGHPGLAAAYGHPGLAAAYGYPGYAPAPLPLIVLTKEDLDSLKLGDYDAEPAVEYVAKPKKPAAKVAVLPKAYAPAKPKVVKKIVKAYAAPVKVKHVVKVVKDKSYALPAAVEVIAPTTVVPAYAAAAVTEAPTDLYPAIEGRAATGNELQASTSATKPEAAQAAIEGGESARTSENSISSQNTISRIS